MIDGVGERTGGVPLFVEEVTRLLLERDEQGGAQAIPPTLQQSLAARLDRLGEAREVAQIGAVLGRDFSYRLLSDVSSTAAGFDELRLQAALDRLTEADLLFVDGAPPTAAYRFKHALIQDAAYESLLKSRRQALHRRAAEALREARTPSPKRSPIISPRPGSTISRSNGGARRATRRCAARPSRRRSPISARRSPWRTRRARRRTGGCGRAGRATAAIARRLRQRAHRGARLRRAGNDGSVRKSPRVGVRRQGRAGTIGGRLRLMGRQLHARRAAVDAGARRRPSSATSRRDPIRPRPASPIAPPGSLAGSPASIAKRGIIWNARSPCSNPAATTIWPFASDRTPASRRWLIWRLRRGLWARSIARFRSSTRCRRGSRASPISARSRMEECSRPCSN